MTTADGKKKEALHWRKPALLRREYTLWVGDTALAWLRQEGWFPTRAYIYEQSGESAPLLRVERRGIWRQKLHVKTLDDRFPHAAPTDLSWRGETWLALDNGRSYHLRPTNFWQTQWELRDEQGNLCFALRRNAWGFGGEILPGPVSLPPDQMRFLLYVAWNVIIMKMDDQAAAA